MEKWMHIDEKNYALSNLEELTDLLKREISTNKPQHWPIIIINLQNTIQAFMVWSLTGGTYSRVLRPADSKKYLALIDTRNHDLHQTKFEELRLDSFLNLYEKIKSPKQMRLYNDSNAFNATQKPDEVFNDVVALKV